MAIATRAITSALLIATFSSAASAIASDMIQLGTPQGAQALAQLQQAEDVDRMNYQSYLGSRENDVAMYYLTKHRHVVEDLKQLRSGEPISSEELKHDLDTSEAWRYGSTF